MGDLFDAPRRRAEEEGLADAGLEDHLFVQLADPRAPFFRAGQKHPVQAAVGNRSAADDGHQLRSWTRGDLVRHSIPGDSRPQLRELIRWIETGEHVQHAVKRRAGQVGERRGAANDREQLVGVPVVHRHHGHDLLGQDIERIARISRRLDRSAMHRFGDRSTGQEIAAIFRKDDPVAHRVHLVRGPADALHAAGNRRRRLDLDHQIDRSHVDSQLQGRRGHQRRQAAGLQVVLDFDALRAGDRAVMCLDQSFSGQLIERRGESLREPARVDEDQRGAVRPDQLQESRMDRRPDRAARFALRGTRCHSADFTEFGHLLHRDLDAK